MSASSPFASIFMAIRQHIMDASNAAIYVDQDLGQLRNNSRPPVTWPCILIDFEDFRFEDMGEHVQTAKGTVVFQLGFAPRSNSAQATPDQYVQQALSYYEYEFALHQLIHGWSPAEASGSLIRTSAATQKRSDKYRVRELRYSLAFQDYSTKDEQQMTNAALVLADKIVLPV